MIMINGVDIEAKIRELENENRALRNDLRECQSRFDNRKKLTDDEVREIRRFRRTAGMTHAELGRMYDVHPVTIGRILDRTYYKDVY